MVKKLNSQVIKNNQVEVDKTEAVIIKNSNEPWAEYVLGDGTLIKIKPVIIDIRKVKGKKSENGDPIYQIKTAVITDVQHSKKGK